MIEERTPVVEVPPMVSQFCDILPYCSLSFSILESELRNDPGLRDLLTFVGLRRPRLTDILHPGKSERKLIADPQCRGAFPSRDTILVIERLIDLPDDLRAFVLNAIDRQCFLPMWRRFPQASRWRCPARARTVRGRGWCGTSAGSVAAVAPHRIVVEIHEVLVRIPDGQPDRPVFRAHQRHGLVLRRDEILRPVSHGNSSPADSPELRPRPRK